MLEYPSIELEERIREEMVENPALEIDTEEVKDNTYDDSQEEEICKGIGVDPEHLKVVVPLPQNMEEITRILREEINYRGLSVIIPRRECIQTLTRKAKAKNKQ